MGTILRDRYNFSRLDGIREAYSAAFFKKSAQVDAALSDKSLDALSSVRNLIFHRSAVVDNEYRDRSKHLSIPRAEVGTTLLIDGETAAKLVRPVLNCSTDLLSSVDNWIVSN
jgi:hypothetical protein